MKTPGAIRVIVTVLLLLAALTSCGRKTALIPPEAATPVAIDDLTPHLDARGVTLSWTYPALAESGRRLDRIRNFQILKSEVAADNFCADCPVSYTKSFSLDARGGKPGETFRFEDSQVKPRYHYTYKVVSRSGFGIASRDSNLVSFQWQLPAGAPVGLKLQAADSRIELSWQPVKVTASNAPLADQLRYQVYRSRDGKIFAPLGEPVDGLSLVDQGLENDRKYYYRVKAVRTLDGHDLPGVASQVIAGMARDMTPPPPPSGFTLVALEDQVKILWESVAAKDVAGYRIYRRLPGESEYALVGEVEGGAFSFTDTDPPRDVVSWSYVVTSYDRAQPANESVFSEEIVLKKK